MMVSVLRYTPGNCHRNDMHKALLNSNLFKIQKPALGQSKVFQKLPYLLRNAST